MKNEKGITLTTLVVTIMIMSILAVVIIRASSYRGVLNKINTISEDFDEDKRETDEKIEEIEEQWEGVI